MRFKSIQLVCGGGFSSSFMANKFRAAAKERNWDTEINASSDGEIDYLSEEIDLLLVGPHLAYLVDELAEDSQSKGYEVVLIPGEIYARIDGDALADFVENL